MKYLSVKGYVLTCTAKTYRDSIWRVVLVGRYPRGHKIFLCPRTMAPHEEFTSKKINKGDRSK